MTIRQKGEPKLPVFVCIAVISTPPAQPEHVQLADDLAAAGALVLHPDEFLAALNPEFMIEWATPRLGAGHPALVEAQRLLDEQRFFESLIAVRVALRQSL
jgi:hypothetical protein